MFGRLPWLAFERRMRALRFLVFFDIGVKTIGQKPEPHRPVKDPRWACQPCRQRARPLEYGTPEALVLEQT